MCFVDVLCKADFNLKLHSLELKWKIIGMCWNPKNELYFPLGLLYEDNGLKQMRVHVFNNELCPLHSFGGSKFLISIVGVTVYCVEASQINDLNIYEN